MYLRRYDCPLYKTSLRSSPDNFVIALELPVPADSETNFWIEMGTSALLSLDE